MALTRLNIYTLDDDDNPTQTATVAVVTQGTSRGEEQRGNTHEDNSIAGATAEIVTNGNNTKEETGHRKQLMYKEYENKMIFYYNYWALTI
jgi:hypothetical protein